MGAPTAAALGAVRRDSRARALGRATPDRRAHNFGKAGDPAFLIVREALRADLDAINEGAVVILPELGTRGRSIRRMDFHFLIQR